MRKFGSFLIKNQNIWRKIMAFAIPFSPSTEGYSSADTASGPTTPDPATPGWSQGGYVCADLQVAHFLPFFIHLPEGSSQIEENVLLETAERLIKYLRKAGSNLILNEDLSVRTAADFINDAQMFASLLSEAYDQSLVAIYSDIADENALEAIDAETIDQRADIVRERLVQEANNYTEIIIGGCKIACLPPEICLLPRLTELGIYGQPVCCLPEELKTVTSLTSLEICRCKLTHVPDWIGGFPELKKLYLTRNCFSQLPDSIGNLIQLEELTLGFNTRLTSLPHSLAQLTALTTLSISTELLGQLPDEIGNRMGIEQIMIPPEVNQETAIAFLVPRDRAPRFPAVIREEQSDDAMQE